MLNSRRLAAVVSLVTVMSTQIPVLADASPYQSYTYDYRENVVLTPAPYLPGTIVNGASLGIAPLSQPRDIAASDDGRLFVADTGNNRIVV
ncbi:MAG: gluconolactonase, partial [Oscillospiraceae bacterium]|nr:gluconolactonase [Oscillospiraceae bacterium]